MHIILLSEAEARQLLTELQTADSKGNYGLHSLRVAVEGDSAKFKVNGWMWSPPMGQLDPASDEAARRKEAAK